MSDAHILSRNRKKLALERGDCSRTEWRGATDASVSTVSYQPTIMNPFAGLAKVWIGSTWQFFLTEKVSPYFPGMKV
ncbi:hypothetical protein DR64_7602 [Paraburkholderia xenovorans LB400]|uniref:hypothetical protein n=1 Tax=Paraburkholderia xenovorans TaxID=36873 RepID=UPI0004F675B2|nr:hypothetical protein [Paraburkholderia xenovorans]AIP34243.1 hypothetical protein DR64_7602 [Paraburkholderia xenovorans LB400]